MSRSTPLKKPSIQAVSKADYKGIYVVSPSSAVADAKVLTRGVQRLEKMGFKVALDRNVLACTQRFAGTDAQRLAAFDRAIKQKLPIVMARSSEPVLIEQFRIMTQPDTPKSLHYALPQNI